MSDENQTTEVAEEAKLTPIAKCQIMHDKGMAEDDIIGALAEHDNMSIMKAVGVFKKFQKAAGLILTKEDRQAKIEELISAGVDTVYTNGKGEVVEKGKQGKTGTVETTVDVKGITAALEAQLQLSGGAAKGHMRRYCKAHALEMPSRQQLATEALEEYKDFVVAGAKAGKSKAELAKSLAENFESMEDEKAARRAVARIAKANDIELGRGGSDHSAVIAFLHSPEAAELATKDGLANVLVEKLGLSLSAGKRVWGQYQFAKQFAAYGVEAAAEAGNDE